MTHVPWPSVSQLYKDTKLDFQEVFLLKLGQPKGQPKLCNGIYKYPQMFYLKKTELQHKKSLFGDMFIEHRLEFSYYLKKYI